MKGNQEIEGNKRRSKWKGSLYERMYVDWQEESWLPSCVLLILHASLCDLLWPDHVSCDESAEFPLLSTRTAD